VLLELPEVPEDVPELSVPLEVPALPEPLDWFVVADCELEALGLVIVESWFALAPLVTVCEPFPTFTPGLMSAPAFTLEFCTSTFASTPTFGFTLRLLELPEVPAVPPEAWSEEEPDVPVLLSEDGVEAPFALLVEPEPDDWLLEAPCESEDDEFVLDDCWSALAPLVTLWEPLPTLMPGLTSAPMFALEFATPTFAFTPTFGFTLSEREVLVLSVDSLFSVPLALRSVELEELLLEGFVVEAEPFRFVALEELLEGCDDVAPFTLTSVELELLEGDCVDPAPFRLMSVELDELPPGIVAVEPFTPVLMSVCEEELAPGTTAAPGPRSVVVVVLLPARASGTLGMHPAGCVLAASMHFGAPSGILTVKVSARAAP
jgi:hypothetical protein